MAEPEKVVEKGEVALREEETLAFWIKEKIFEKSLTKDAPKGDFVFYDGPPFATGLPHTGSLLASVIKDVVPRYKTMRGFRVPRKWGWDCHGLPVESLIEKQLNLKTKKDIEKIGVDTFNEAARASVLKFVDDWEKYVSRVGRWVDFKNSYKTMDNSYIESVWWTLKRLNGKKLLYEGKKVLMYCVHCETPLAKAEIAMDNTYKMITEEAVTVKFKMKNQEKRGIPANAYILAWTTTPWTLPGNVALAVNPTIPYVLVQKGDEYLMVAKERVSAVFGGGGGVEKLPSENGLASSRPSSVGVGENRGPFQKEVFPDVVSDVVSEFLGKELIGAEYEPLYTVPAIANTKGKKYVVVGADFVSTEDGTGVVHIAPMYGEDDFAVGKKEGLPMVQLLLPNGNYTDLVPEFLRGLYLKAGSKFIKEDLEKRGILFGRAPHSHSYPHCYRCGTPLIYNAVVSWFINIQKVKSRMLAENEKITWVPEHLKHGRFKHNVETAPDWTISRNRFWASPLPIWKEKGGDGLMVVGSLDELLVKTKHSGNTYFVMRHGEAQANLKDIFETKGDVTNHLTETGKEQARTSAEWLKKHGPIDLIVHSPLVRTRETAYIAQKVLGLTDSAMMVDERLREMGVGILEGKTFDEWDKYFDAPLEQFTKRAIEGAETFTDIRRRVGAFLFEIDKRYSGKNILIVTHECPGWLLNAVASRQSIGECMEDRVQHGGFLTRGQVKPLSFASFPHNANFELDLHRPYIDAVTLFDKAGRAYERIPEVIDCWVESGAMPFASAGYPKNKKTINPIRWFGLAPKGYPGDFIAEYIAQTRTWFYYMHALGILLFNKRAFNTVVSTGTLLASDGAKISKSKGNYTDPMLLMDRFGADAFRFHLMGSVVMQAEDLQFKDEDVREVHNRVVGMIWNSYKFYELYKASYSGKVRSSDSPHVLDRWIRARLADVALQTTQGMDAFNTPSVCRVLREFVDDYSTWYLRRSRARVKTDTEDKQFALATQHDVLIALAKLTAPLMPFLAENVYRGVGGDMESVHLDVWPDSWEFLADAVLLEKMKHTRATVSQALDLRERANIKVRQPLAALYLPRTIDLASELELLALIKDEVNIKNIEFTDDADMRLDTSITPELKEEGTVRDIVRQIQDFRKKEKLTIDARPSITITTNKEGEAFFKKQKEVLIKETGLAKLSVNVSSEEATAQSLQFPVVIALEK